MPDAHGEIKNASPAVLAGLVSTLELRAADPQQRAMIDSYLADAAIPEGARVLSDYFGHSA